MSSLQEELEQFNAIQYAHHRVAFKLRYLQKRFHLDKVALSDVQECCGRAGVSCCLKEVVPVPQLDKVLSTVYASIAIPHDQLMEAQALAFHWMISACRDVSDGGNIHAGTLRLVLCLFCGSKLQEKGKGLFSLLSSSDQSGRVEMETLSWLLHTLHHVVQGSLGEVLYPGNKGWNSELEEQISLRCLEYVQASRAGQLRAWISSMEFGRLLVSSPAGAAPTLSWLAIWQNLPLCENIQHSARCSICRQKPIVGLCYECLQCPSVLCQNCHLIGRTSRKSKHASSHRVREFQVPYKGGSNWSSRLLCIAPHTRGIQGSVMDDTVMPYSPRAISPASNSSQSSLADQTSERQTPSLPQKPAPVVYRISRSGSSQQPDQWQTWNGTNQVSTPHVPALGTLDMDVDGYFKRYSQVSSHDSISVTTTDTLDSVPGRPNQSASDVSDYIAPPGNHDNSSGSAAPTAANRSKLKDQVTQLTAERQQLSSELQGLIGELQKLQQGKPLNSEASPKEKLSKRHTLAFPDELNRSAAPGDSQLDHEILQLLQFGSNPALEQ